MLNGHDACRGVSWSPILYWIVADLPSNRIHVVAREGYGVSSAPTADVEVTAYGLLTKC